MTFISFLLSLQSTNNNILNRLFFLLFNGRWGVKYRIKKTSSTGNFVVDLCRMNSCRCVWNIYWDRLHHPIASCRPPKPQFSSFILEKDGDQNSLPRGIFFLNWRIDIRPLPPPPKKPSLSLHYQARLIGISFDNESFFRSPRGSSLSSSSSTPKIQLSLCNFSGIFFAPFSLSSTPFEPKIYLAIILVTTFSNYWAANFTE